MLKSDPSRRHTFKNIVGSGYGYGVGTTSPSGFTSS